MAAAEGVLSGEETCQGLVEDEGGPEWVGDDTPRITAETGWPRMEGRGGGGFPNPIGLAPNNDWHLKCHLSLGSVTFDYFIPNCLIYFIFFFFGCLRHVECLGQGADLSLSYGNSRSFTHCARLEMARRSQCSKDAADPQWELLFYFLLIKKMASF